MRTGPLACWALVMGCGGGAAPVASVGHHGAATAGPAACVEIEAASWWRSELFPSCPPPPLPPHVICQPGGCARPCAVRVTGPDGDVDLARYRYDEAGHLVEIWSDDTRTTCTWRDDRLERCSTDGRHHERAMRDAAGALVAIESVHGNRHDVVRAGGRIVSFDIAELRYDSDGRIIAVGDRSIEYDAAGRIVSDSDDPYESTWTYDDHGRLREIATSRRVSPELGAGEDDQPRLTQIFEYDAAGRLIAVHHERRHESDSGSTHYEYDCR